MKKYINTAIVIHVHISSLNDRCEQILTAASTSTALIPLSWHRASYLLMSIQLSSANQLMRSQHPDKGLVEVLPFWWTRYHKQYSWYALPDFSSPLSYIAQSSKALLTALLTFFTSVFLHIWKARKASQLSSPFLALLFFCCWNFKLS